ncbi:conserved hypothetical protein [Bradyrhizobium oligotrophicum S58]|uniref:Uncharacterized protein n=1 Tax=Bradyrhizobium oligotrophicum S58 TaxID=1245469 RepID=M4Z3M6_9BRAD|nr:hypothetical protein [Bradyrhizobium oligotrophicum]BAM87457.1 conserved hypothetical protein [Bradyrhizobium oligotrophicum S58]
MSDLLDLVLKAHGAAHWKRFRTIEGDMSIVGALWARKGWPNALRKVRVTADLAQQELSYEPFTAEGLRSSYRPDLVAIDTDDGKRIKQRANPRDAFAGHTPATPWDDLHLAYFSGYAMWNYLNAPFLLAMQGFTAEEIEPWIEDHQTWRRLKVTFPESIATHSREKVFHVDDNGLIARLDYFADVSGGVPSAHYTSDYRDFEGIKIATRRRAYLRHADGTPIRDMIAVAIDIGNIRFS